MTVPKTGTVKEHGVFEQRAIAFVYALHFAEHVGELAVVPGGDHVVHVALFRNGLPRVDAVIVLALTADITVVRQRMPSAANTVNEVEVSVALPVIQHQRTHTRGSRPKTKHHQIHHGTHVLLVIIRNAQLRSFKLHPFHLAKRGFVGLFFGKLHPAFHCTKRLQILVNLLLIYATDATLQTLRLAIDQVNHALVGDTVAGFAKHPIIDCPWIGITGRRQFFAHPRNGIARQAVGEISLAFHRHIERRQHRVFANLTRDDLVDRRASGTHARTAVRTPGQPSRRTGSVTIATGRPNVSSNQNVFLEWLEVLHPLVQFQKLAIAPNLLRLPAALGHAVGEIKITDTQLRPLGRHCQRRQRLHRFKPRQSHGCTHCPKHGSS